MTDLTDYTENWIMNWVRGTTAPAAPASVYVGLFSSNPTDTGTAGTEVTTTIRPAGRLAAGFGTITAGQIVNAADIDFGTAAGTAAISHIALFDAASAGNMLAYKALAVASDIAAASQVKILAGSLTFSIT